MKQAAEAVLIHRSLPFGPEEAYAAFIDPRRLADWFAPFPDWRTVVHELDARVGGSFVIDMVPPDGPVKRLHGTYTDLRKDRAVAFTWRWEGSREQTAVHVELSATPTGCDLALTHGRFADEESRAEHARGWEACLQRLASRGPA